MCSLFPVNDETRTPDRETSIERTRVAGTRCTVNSRCAILGFYSFSAIVALSPPPADGSGGSNPHHTRGDLHRLRTDVAALGLRGKLAFGERREFDTRDSLTEETLMFPEDERKTTRERR